MHGHRQRSAGRLFYGAGRAVVQDRWSAPYGPFGDRFGGISSLAGEAREAKRRKEHGCARHPTTSVTGTSSCTKARHVPQANLLETRHDAVEASSVPFDGDTSRRSAAGFTIRDFLPFGGSRMLAGVSMSHARGKPLPAPPFEIVTGRRPSMSGDGPMNIILGILSRTISTAIIVPSWAQDP